MINAGFPRTIEYGGTEPLTTEPSETTEAKPMEVPGANTERAAIQDSESIKIGSTFKSNELDLKL